MQPARVASRASSLHPPRVTSPGRCPRSRTSPRTGRRSTTRAVSTCPRTSTTGQPPSWPTCSPTAQNRLRDASTAQLFVEQVGLLSDNPVVERLELPPPGAVPADLCSGLL